MQFVVTVRVMRDKARVTIKCGTKKCEASRMVRRSGVTAETHAFEVPESDGRPLREFLTCAGCGRQYEIMIFDAQEVSVKSLEGP